MRRSYRGAVRFSISIPQRVADGFDAEGVRDYLVRAEELGFEGGWTLEQIVGPAPSLAPLELLSWAAGQTTSLRLGVAVLITTMHDPIQLAATVAAVDQLSHGRLDVGVGHGGNFRPFSAFGVDRATFVSYFTEGIELMKTVWDDRPTVSFHGSFRDVEALPIRPAPVQRPHPPLWIGGSAPKAVRRAVRLGDAFMGAGSSTTEVFTEAVRTVRRELDGLHKDPAGFTIAKRIYLTVDDDRALARERVLAGLHRIYGDAMASRLGDVPVSGTPSDVIRGISDVIEAGAQMVLLNPVGATVAEDREQMERLAAEVIPQLNAV
jgi:alkanesulfonate monooxygenase SsuD/methylene tetrahydromethanopterin reductase-like flavin-dependent oxidoreductase (luciferase family)